jgi:hypothetical protein
MVVLGWVVLSILIAFALYFFIFPDLKRYFTLVWFSFRVWKIARKQPKGKNKEDLKNLLNNSKKSNE